MLAEADRVAADAARCPSSTRPTSRWSPSTRRAARDLDQAVHLARAGRRLPGLLRDRRRRRVRRRWAARSTPRPAAAARPSTAPTAGRRCTRRSCARARPACCPTSSGPAALWTIDLDADGESVAVDLRRARVRSRAQLDYPRPVRPTPGCPPEPLALLPEIGRLLQARARDRGAIELGTPSQEVEAGPGRRLDRRLPRRSSASRAWNAQISLLTGRCAARLMLDGGVGVLRTLPPARPGDVGRAAPAGARRSASTGPTAPPPATSSPALDPAQPRHAAFLDEAAIAAARCGLHRRSTAHPPDAARPRRRRRALRPRHRPAAPAGRPVRHRGVPGAGRRAASRRPSCGPRCRSCRR